MYRDCVVLIKLLIISISVSSQEIVELDSELGLTSNFVLDLLQAENESLYFAMKYGMDRFDGNDVKNYSHDPFNSYSISPHIVHLLREDKRGYIYG